jgi:hypothetical protein
LTRSSLVTHFFTRSDCLALASELRPAPGGWWMRRPAPAPRDEPAPAASPTIDDTPAAEIPHLGAPPTGAPLPARELRERLATLDPEDDRVGP